MVRVALLKNQAQMRIASGFLVLSVIVAHSAFADEANGIGKEARKGGEAVTKGVENGGKALAKGAKKAGEWIGSGLKKAGDNLEKASKK